MADTSMGGLLAGHTSVSLFGPPGLSTMVNAIRTYVNTRDVGLGVSEFGAAPVAAATAVAEPGSSSSDSGLDPIISNSVVTITPVVLYPSAPGTTLGLYFDSCVESLLCWAAYAQHVLCNLVAAVRVADPLVPPADATGATTTGTAAEEGAAAGGEPGAKRARLENGAAATNGRGGAGEGEAAVAGEGPAACYICQLPSIPGKFLLAKAVALGVPRGPLYGRLVKVPPHPALNQLV